MKNQEIVSWLTVNNYSKLNEYSFFIFCALLVPLMIGFVWSFFSPKRFVKYLPESSSNLELVFQYIFVPICLYFALYQSNLGGMVDLYHEGEMLVPVQMSLAGLSPYKDFYLQHGLIRNFLMPLTAVSFYGETIEAVRMLFHQIEPLAYIFLYYVGLMVFRGGLVSKTLSAVFPLVFCSSYHYWIGPRQGLMLLSLAFLLRWIYSLYSKRESLFFIFFAGLSSSICFWFSVDYGIYSIAACILILILLRYLSEVSFDSKRAFVAYIFGLFVVSFPILLWLGSIHALDDFYENLYQQIFYQSRVWGSPFPGLDFTNTQTLRVYSSILILSLLGLYVSWAANSSRRKINYNTATLMAVFIFAFFCFRTALGRSDYGHWIDGSTLIFIILFIPFNYYFFKSQANLKTRLMLVALFIPLVYFLSVEHQVSSSFSKRIDRYGYNKEVENLEPLTRLGGVDIPKAQKKTLENVLKFIALKASSKNEYIYDFSNQAGYYFLANKPSPTKYFQASYAATNKMQERVVSDLKLKKPRLIIFSTGTSYDAIDGISSTLRQSIIYSYIKAHYKPAATFDSTVILEKRL